jgi:predicted deacylase
MACAFQLPLVWGTSAELPGRSLSVARDAGVPAIYAEYLGAHRELAELASIQRQGHTATDHPLVTGCLQVMRHLRMLTPLEPNNPVATDSQTQQTIEDWRGGSGHMQVCNPAPARGFLRLLVQLGQQVSPGSVLAVIESTLGDPTHNVVSRQSGTVVVVRDYPMVNPGDSVAVIAEHFQTA